MKGYKINDFKVDWLSLESCCFFDPKHPEKNALHALARKLPFYAGHICLFTSGGGKAVFISKEAALISARAVNRHLQCRGKKKLWLAPLPLFHVGGLAVPARAFAGGYSFARWERPWGAKAFQKALSENRAAYTSLVPLQVYDLVRAEAPPPPSLEFALVGGAALTVDLWKKARALGWPLLPAYGMTEAFSQIAAAERSSLKRAEPPPLKLLSHMEARVKSSVIEVRSPSLLTAYYERETGRLYDPKTKEGWFRTQDHGLLKGRSLKIQGRADDAVKVSGRLIHLSLLTEKLAGFAKGLAPEHQFFVIALPDERKGHSLALVTDCFQPDLICSILKRFNQAVPHFQKLRAVYIAEHIREAVTKHFPSSALKKPSSAALKKALSL